jgi:RHS repeat-associated protein
VTTVYLGGGLWEEEFQNGTSRTTRALYSFKDEMVAQREGSSVRYFHNDHLESVSVTTDASGAPTNQDFAPWGTVRAGGITQTSLHYTGQRRDETGLLYYHARYYDPALGRFLSADSVVPDATNGVVGIDAEVAFAPLTVAFHTPEFVNALNKEHRFARTHGLWFQLDAQQRSQAKQARGPENPQALNRYTYVLNNPLRYTDPTGHVAWWVAGGMLGGASSFATSYGSQVWKNYRSGYGWNSFTRNINWRDVGQQTTLGAASGALGYGVLKYGGRAASWAVGRTIGQQSIRFKFGYHDAHHYFPRFGQRLPHFQVNWWRQGVKRSGGVFRAPTPHSWYRAWNRFKSRR